MKKQLPALSVVNPFRMKAEPAVEVDKLLNGKKFLSPRDLAEAFKT